MMLGMQRFDLLKFYAQRCFWLGYFIKISGMDHLLLAPDFVLKKSLHANNFQTLKVIVFVVALDIYLVRLI
jgi:hypothetical protein